MVAALVGVALALIARNRRQSRLVLAGRNLAEAEVLEPAEPAAPDLSPPPVADPAPALPSGLVTTRLRPAIPPAVREQLADLPPAPVGAVVSTGLRPRVDLDLTLDEILLTLEEVVIRFQISVVNGGSATARDISIEALPLNAGDDQGSQIDSFFARSGPAEAGITELPRLGSRALVHEVRMARDAVRLYEVEGRQLFVPVLAFLARYRWRGGTGRTGAAFLLGHETRGSDRLAPLRLDTAVPRLTGLGVRRLDEQVRR